MTSFNESLVKTQFMRKEETGEFLLMKLKLKQAKGQMVTTKQEEEID